MISTAFAIEYNKNKNKNNRDYLRIVKIIRVIRYKRDRDYKSNRV